MTSGGIDFFPSPDDAATPEGSERSLWWMMNPRQVGTGGNGYMNARWRQDSADALAGLQTGAAGAYSFQVDGTNGAYRRHQGVTNAAPAYVTLGNDTGALFLPSRMDQTSLFAPPGQEVFIFRELIQSFASGPLPGGHQMMHGFSLIGNLLAGFPQLTAGSWRGIALCERTADVILAVKNANPATIITLPGLSLSAGRVKVEHRLYAPTASEVGRYELWINEALVATVLGTHPNFPHPAALTEGWKCMPFSLNNPGTATTAGFRCWWGEIIAGPNSAGTF